MPLVGHYKDTVYPRVSRTICIEQFSFLWDSEFKTLNVSLTFFSFVCDVFFWDYLGNKKELFLNQTYLVFWTRLKKLIQPFAEVDVEI